MSAQALSVHAPAEEEMVALGAALGAAVGKAQGSASGKAHGSAGEQGLVIFLEGELGMGKTTLARGFAQALGHRGAVKSPTYTIVEPYELVSTTLYHFDLYRLDDPQELELMGIRDYFGENSICLVEWPARGLGVLPRADIVVTIVSEGSGRRLALEAATDRGRSVLQRLDAT